MSELAEQHGNDGTCRHCGARLSLVKRMSRQEFCSAEHREEFLRAHGDAALGRLQEAAKPRPSTVQGLGLSRPATDPTPAKPVGSILGLSAPPPPRAPEPPPAEPRRAAPSSAAPFSAKPAAAEPSPAAPPQVRRAEPPPERRAEPTILSPEPAAPAAPPAAKTLPPNFRTAKGSAPAAPPPSTTMALARTKPRPSVSKNAPLDPALGRLMESSSPQQPPVARAPMRFTPGRVTPPPEPEAPVVRAAPPAEPPQAPVPHTVQPAAFPEPSPSRASRPMTPSTAEPAELESAEPVVEAVTVERRGARPPASFVLTGQLAFGPREPRHWDDYEWEPVLLTPTALPAPVLFEETIGMLKIDGERIPGTVDQVKPVAGDLMTILVVRASPALLPGIMEFPSGGGVEPNDWQAFAQYVRQKIREQDGPDPAWLVEMPEVAARSLEGGFVQALFGADRFWPNPKTYIVYPSRELVRRPLLQHANLPVEQDTVPLLVSRTYEAAHRRVLAEWSPNEGDTSIPAAGAVPPEVEATPGDAVVQDAASQPTAMQAPSVLPHSGLSPTTPLAFPEPLAARPALPEHAAPSLPVPSRPAPAHLASSGPAAFPSRSLNAPVWPAPATSIAARTVSATLPSGAEQVSLGGFAGSVVLPRFGMRMATDESRPLVVLHRQPPVARLVSLELEPADRDALPAPAPPVVHDTIQPEIRQAPSGRPVGSLATALRLHTLLALDGTELDTNSPPRGADDCQLFSWLEAPRPSVPSAGIGIRRARVPVLHTAVRLAGADRAAEFFLSPAPVEFAASVDQWSAL